MNGQTVFSVTALNQFIKELLDSETSLNNLYVRGELSNFKLHSSGHMYMTLKDENSSIRAVMFKGDAFRLKFRPDSGMRVIAFGRISVYPRDGAYQLYIGDMQPDGIGALYLAFEQLKTQLAQEGLFDAAHKKELPLYPERIALITSPTGAAIRDMLTILRRRYPIAQVTVVPVLVQGEGAPEDIARAIALVNQLEGADLIITGRGGGSMEDLWAFNDVRVARAIFSSQIPVISAVGHEPDFTIADFVADVRAATPSNAAELAVPDGNTLALRLLEYKKALLDRMLNRLSQYKSDLKSLRLRPVLARPDGYISENRQYLDSLTKRVALSAERMLAEKHTRFVRLAVGIDALSPLKVLARGYSLTQNEQGRIIRSADEVRKGERLRITLSKSEIDVLVENTEVEHG